VDFFFKLAHDNVLIKNPKDQNWELKEVFLENQVFLTFPKEKMTF